MKETTVEYFSADPTSFLQAAQQERVLVTRGGKPLALLVGLANKDQEDWDLETSPAFWRYPDADPNRIGMWGHSMGGYITMRSMVITDEIKAGVIWAGVVASYPDLLTRWRRGSGAAVTHVHRRVPGDSPCCGNTARQRKIRNSGIPSPPIPI